MDYTNRHSNGHELNHAWLNATCAINFNGLISAAKPVIDHGPYQNTETEWLTNASVNYAIIASGNGLLYVLC